MPRLRLVAVAVLGSLTVLPAVLSLLGDNVDRPRITDSGIDFGGEPTNGGEGAGNGEPRDAVEAEEVPEVDSPLDNE